MIASGLLVLRLTLAVVLIAHGAHDLFGAFAGPGAGQGGLQRTTDYISSLGLKPASLIAIAHGSLELAGGLLIAAGWFTRPAAVVLATYLGFIVYKDSARWGFFLNWMLDPTRGHGMELSVLIIGGLVALCLSGAGDWSIDGRRATSAARRAAGRARLRRN